MENSISIEQWSELRRKGHILLGNIKCAYGDIFLPDSDGVIHRVWSFNRHWQRDGKNGTKQYDDFVPIVYDAPYFELSWSDSKNPFLYQSGEPLVSKLEFDNPDKLHIGRLTKEALEEIRIATQGKGELVKEIQENGNYVFYSPHQFAWEDLGEGSVENTTKKGKAWWLYVLMALGILNS